jgi:hypothetical protein
VLVTRHRCQAQPPARVALGPNERDKLIHLVVKPHGRFAIFLDVAGNRSDLLGVPTGH